MSLLRLLVATLVMVAAALGVAFLLVPLGPVPGAAGLAALLALGVALDRRVMP